MDSKVSDPRANAAFALHRFGFGPRAGSIDAIASDPRGALLADLARPGAGRLVATDLRTSADAARAAFEFRQERRALRLSEQAKRIAAKAADGGSTASAPANAETNPAAAPGGNDAKEMANAPKPNPPPPIPQQIYREEAKARIDAALTAEIGFCERLAWFWSNHFCVSADKGGVRPLAGAYEREAIRPHVVGRFGDMLLAVETHPAMLLYLDNARSIGPGSQAGINRGKGLNENLAREILELHTLGVRTVYTQDDVTRFAKVITGWTIVPAREEHGGVFRFEPRMHEPGPQTVIGKLYSEETMDQGRAVLATLARHPATARHVANKLVHHFISDQPVPALSDKLTRRFLETDGNLREVGKTLVTAPEAWDPANPKLKRPAEWIVASLRATGVTPPDINHVMQAQNLLGEPLWRPTSPAGYSDDDAAWLDGVAQRLDIANQMARRVADAVDPNAAVETALGPLASDDTKTAVRRAESRPQALTMLFMAPEFQRR